MKKIVPGNMHFMKVNVNTDKMSPFLDEENLSLRRTCFFLIFYKKKRLYNKLSTNASET